MAVIICGIEAEELGQAAAEIKKQGCTCLPRVADVTKEDQVHCMVEETRGAFGRIDVLINNAAVVGPTAAVGKMNRREWDDVLAVNLTGPMLCCKAVLPAMMKARSGRIVNISSIAGRIGYALRSAYAASKWGLLGLTLTLAKEVAQHPGQRHLPRPRHRPAHETHHRNSRPGTRPKRRRSGKILPPTNPAGPHGGSRPRRQPRRFSDFHCWRNHDGANTRHFRWLWVVSNPESQILI
jgi:hypothetical protein